MAPVTRADGEETSRDFHVHLTGFGPFRDYTINPSWEAVRPLDGTTVTAFSPRPIHITASLLPVSYTSCSSLIPPLHSPEPYDSAPTPRVAPDLIVHVGVGSAGGIKLERRARKWGYEKKDVDGELAQVEKGGDRRGVAETRYEPVDLELRTRVDGARVRDWVKKQGVQQIELSEDAGLYLCEFTFFTSLASAQLANPSSPTPVQFVHVPPLDQPYTVRQLTQAIRLIVVAIANEQLSK